MNSFDKEILADYTKSKPDDFRRRFYRAYMARRKGVGPAICFALFLGGVGAHHFYLGSTTAGIIYALLCWTFIPGIIALFEAFAMKGRVANANRQIADDVLDELELIG